MKGFGSVWGPYRLTVLARDLFKGGARDPFEKRPDVSEDLHCFPKNSGCVECDSSLRKIRFHNSDCSC